MTKKEKMIHEVMYEFDFSTVRNAINLLALDWGDDEGRIPTLTVIKQAAEKLLSRVYDSKKEESYCGLEAGYEKHNGYERLTLKFVVEEATS